MNQWLILYTNIVSYELVHLQSICTIQPGENGACMVTLSNGRTLFTIHTEDQIFTALGELHARSQENATQEITPVVPYTHPGNIKSIEA